MERGKGERTGEEGIEREKSTDRSRHVSLKSFMLTHITSSGKALFMMSSLTTSSEP